MAAIRHEARGTAREPDGGTPGRLLETGNIRPYARIDVRKLRLKLTEILALQIRSPESYREIAIAVLALGGRA